jgi:hypothetical protein
MAEGRSFQQGQKREEYPDVDELLAAYYGSALPERPLPASSWQQVRSRLGSLPRSRSRSHSRSRGRHSGGSGLYRTRPSAPSYIAEAFLRLSWDARTPFALSTLDCRFKERVRTPAVHVSPSGSGKIRLILPASAMLAMEQPLLDVLLATGMARLLYARKLPYMLGNLLLLSLALLAAVACLVLWFQHRIPLPAFLIAVGLWTLMGIVQHVRGRRLALRADELMVRWLGRARACRGLHMLADRSHRARPGWQEPSLAERIARVCGAGVEAEEEHLTLVR